MKTRIIIEIDADSPMDVLQLEDKIRNLVKDESSSKSSLRVTFTEQFSGAARHGFVIPPEK